MALYTVQEVIDKVKDLIEESTDAAVFTTDRFIKTVSQEQKWVAAESGSYQARGTITLVVNQTEYDAPASTSGVIALSYDHGGDIGVRGLKMVQPENDPHAPDQLKPYFWYYRGNKVTILPEMPVLPTNTTINIITSLLPVDLTALTDSLAIPDEFQIVVPYRVALVVALKDNQLEKASWIRQEIERLTKVGVAEYAHKGSVVGPSGISAPST